MTTLYTKGYYQALRILKAKYVTRISKKRGGNDSIKDKEKKHRE